MKKIFIHIGNFKTASTSLQRFIFLNQNLFKENNIQVLVEKNFGITTNNMALFKHINNMNKIKIKKYFSKVSKKKNLLITCEYFSTFSNDLDRLTFLKNVMRQLGFKPIIIYYYRADSSYLYSFYAELLTHRKSIKIDSVFDFVKKIKKKGYYSNIKNKKYFLSQKYYFNNREIMNNWKKIFKKDFNLIKFDKNKDKKIFTDFLKNLKIKNISQFKIPLKTNKTRKIKFWNLKRIFYYNYLKLSQRKIFKDKDLNIS